MEEKIVYINLEDISKLLKNNKELEDTNTYVLSLDNCNIISTELLNLLEQTKLNIKFKLKGELYNPQKNGITPQYNYNIFQMKEIIKIFEIINNSVSSLNQIGKFIYIYRLLSEICTYNNYFSAESSDLLKTEGNKRSIYGTLIEGNGVCVGFSITLHHLLNYVGINSKIIHGIGTISTGENGKHAWNAVKIDEKWYEVDLTWDLTDKINLPYCLKVNEDFISTHQPYDYYIENELKDLNYAENDFDSEKLYCYNHIITNNKELAFDDTLKFIKQHMKKINIKTIEEMSIKELIECTLGKDFNESLNNKKTL